MNQLFPVKGVSLRKEGGVRIRTKVMRNIQFVDCGHYLVEVV